MAGHVNQKKKSPLIAQEALVKLSVNIIC